MEKKLSDQIKMKEELLAKRQEQVNQQQLYFSLVNKIQEGVRKNETLCNMIHNFSEVLSELAKKGYSFAISMITANCGTLWCVR